MIKIGLFGAGHLGKIHLKLLKNIPDFEVIGFYDPDPECSQKVAESFGIPAFANPEELIAASEAVDIVSPTITHFELAKEAIRQARHVFIEKPLTSTLAEAETLMKLALEAGIKVQVGHVERFNPAFLSVKHLDIQPVFIESHRLAGFNPRGTDVAVVLDLMIHDIDIILSLVKANVRKISASGVAVISNSHDIANARIEFDNGCVANLTASRMSLKQMRKMRIFQKDAYISIDFLEKKSEIYTMSDRPGPEENPGLEIQTGPAFPTRFIHYQEPEVPPVNAIELELSLFASAIEKNEEPEVSLTDGYQAMKVAYEALAQIEKNGPIPFR